MAEKLEMSAENYSRVENDVNPWGPQSEKLFKVLVLMRLFEDKHLKPDVLKSLSKAIDPRIEPCRAVDEPVMLRLIYCCSIEQDSELEGPEKGTWVEPEPEPIAA